MIKRIAAGLIGAAALLSAAAAPAASVITVYADDAYSCDFTVGGSSYVEQEIEKKYGTDGIRLYRNVLEQIAAFAMNGQDIEDDMLIVTVDSSINFDFYIGKIILGYITKNNPQLYWLGNTFGCDARRASDGSGQWVVNKAKIAVIDEFKDGAHRKETSEQLAAVLDEYHELVESKSNTLEKIMAVNDKIDNDTSYVSADVISHRSIGCLLRHECVCEGYSKAFQLICNREGLGDSVFVEGIGYNGTSSEAHGWNLIQFDDAWYFVDSTWNDIIIYDWNGNLLDNSSRWHDYFMRGSAYMEYDHELGAHLYATSDTSDPNKYIDYPLASPVDLKTYLYGDNMKLGESMEYTVYYGALHDETFNNSSFSMSVTVDGAVQNLTGVKKKVDGRDMVAFTIDIPAKNVCDTLKATVSVQDSEETFTTDYYISPQDYLEKLYQTGDSAARRLAAATLNYAAAAQEYKGYSTADIANAALDDGDRQLPEVSADTFAGRYSMEDKDNGVRITAASLDMLSRTRIRVYFRLDESYASAYSDGTGMAEVKLTNTDGNTQTIMVNSAYEALGRCGRDGELYWVETNGISPLSYEVPVTAEITAEGETEADTLSYSVYDYFRSKCAADTGVEKVVAAMYAYGLAAADYSAS